MKNPIKYLRAWLTFRVAVMQAELRFASTGNRQYVIPSKSKRKLIVTSFNEEVHAQGLNNHNALRPDYSHPRTLMNQSFYYTSSFKAKKRWIHGMPKSLKNLRKQMFFSWYFSHS